MGSMMATYVCDSRAVCGNENFFRGCTGSSCDFSSHGKEASLLRLVVQCVAIAFGTSAEHVRHQKRGCAKVARARQVVAYLMHTGLSLTLSDISVLLGRDRTTIGHACRMIEDLRDCPDFDHRLLMLEDAIATIRELLDE